MALTDDIVLSQTDPRPMYQQIMGRVKQLVALGDWAPGEQMPSIRQLAVALQISVITVKRAYLELEREGVIVTRQGKGSMVAEQPGVSLRPRREELREHLVAAARLATRLGVSPDELAAQMLEIHNETAEDSR
jgi:GntR family transcriptional regulator